jgi:DNA replication regulator SLD3
MTEDQKARKKALVDAEVKEAISALKRPNRALVGKEIVQETEQRRASTSLSQLKKARKPVHRMPGVGSAYPAVQVKATPANNRFKDVIAAESQHAASLPELEMIKDEDDFEDRIPASSCVPSSAVTRRTTSTPLPAIQPTPARGSASAASLPSMMMAPISPVLIRKAFLAPLGTAIIAESSPAIGALFETPLKPRSAMGDLSTPIRPLRLTGAGTATPRPSLGIVATPEKTARRSTAPAVAGTPRRSAVVSDDRDLAVTATPQKIVLVTTNRNVAATLGKSSSEEVVVTKTLQPEERCTEENEPVKKTETVSIYKRLGWDDDYDLD